MLNLAEYMASIFIRLADLLALWQNYWTSSWGEQKPTNKTGGAQPCTSFVNKFAESWPVDLFLRYIVGLIEATFWRNSWHLHYCTVQHRYSPKAVHLSLGLAEYTLVAGLFNTLSAQATHYQFKRLCPQKEGFTLTIPSQLWINGHLFKRYSFPAHHVLVIPESYWLHLMING